MYKGEISVNSGIGFMGVEINLFHTISTAVNYETDENTPTILKTKIQARIQDLSKKDREFLESKYQEHKVLKVSVPISTKVSVDDYFNYDEKDYTILQIRKFSNRKILFVKNEPRYNS